MMVSGVHGVGREQEAGGRGARAGARQGCCGLSLTGRANCALAVESCCHGDGPVLKGLGSRLLGKLVPKSAHLPNA